MTLQWKLQKTPYYYTRDENIVWLLLPQLNLMGRVITKAEVCNSFETVTSNAEKCFLIVSQNHRALGYTNNELPKKHKSMQSSAKSHQNLGSPE